MDSGAGPQMATDQIPQISRPLHRLMPGGAAPLSVLENVQAGERIAERAGDVQQVAYASAGAGQYIGAPYTPDHGDAEEKTLRRRRSVSPDQSHIMLAARQHQAVI